MLTIVNRTVGLLALDHELGSVSSQCLERVVQDLISWSIVGIRYRLPDRIEDRQILLIKRAGSRLHVFRDQGRCNAQISAWIAPCHLFKNAGAMLMPGRRQIADKGCCRVSSARVSLQRRSFVCFPSVSGSIVKAFGANAYGPATGNSECTAHSNLAADQRFPDAQ